MNEHQIQVFLQNLYQTPDKRIIEVVFQGYVSMDTIRQNVTAERYNQIQRTLEEQQNQVYLQEFNRIKDDIEDINSILFKDYNDKKFQNFVEEGRITQNLADQLSDILHNRIVFDISRRDRERILEQMRAGHPEYKTPTLKNLLQQGIIYENDLRQLGINDVQIEGIRTFVKERDDNRNEWKDLPPLRENSTDVYLFGPGSSGKTSLLAAILFNAENLGILRPDNTNRAGVRYMDMIKQSIRQGGLPPRTSVDRVNYISVDLRNRNGDYHAVNLIEMSGERFERSYNQSDLSNTIGANQYLGNANRKLIFFVIDYTIDLFNLDFYNDVANRDVIRNVLQLLADDGTLRSCDSLFIVVTKSDLISRNYIEAKEGVTQYVQNSYRNIYNLCLDYQKKFNFDFEVLPSSLGHFILPDIYTYDPEFSDKILFEIINRSRYQNNRPWWRL